MTPEQTHSESKTSRSISWLDSPLPWVISVFVAIVVRVVLTVVIPDFEEDAYTRDLMAQIVARDVQHGEFGLHSLMRVSVWLPSWHLVCGIIASLGFNPYWVSKILSALFGGLTAHLAGKTAYLLDPRHRTANLAWGVTLLWPWHLLYSTQGVTEAYYGFWIAWSVYWFLRADRSNRGLLYSALALSPALWTRFESWIFIPALLLIALVQRRSKLSLIVVSGITLMGVVGGWFFVNWYVTGDPLHFAKIAGETVQLFYQLRGGRVSVSLLATVRQHLYAISVVGIVGTLATVLHFRSFNREGRTLSVLCWITFLYLMALWFAQKHVGWRRYYVPLVVFTSPLVGYQLTRLSKTQKLLQWSLGVEWVVNLAIAVRLMIAWIYPYTHLRSSVASTVSTLPGIIYCDEPSVRLMSNVSPERFVNQWSGATRQQQANWIVFIRTDHSRLTLRLPWLQTMRDGNGYRIYRVFHEARINQTIAIYQVTPTPRADSPQ